MNHASEITPRMLFPLVSRGMEELLKEAPGLGRSILCQRLLLRTFWIYLFFFFLFFKQIISERIIAFCVVMLFETFLVIFEILSCCRQERKASWCEVVTAPTRRLSFSSSRHKTDVQVTWFGSSTVLMNRIWRSQQENWRDSLNATEVSLLIGRKVLIK